MQPTAPAALLVLVLCAWQLGLLARTAWSPSLSPKAESTCGFLCGDLRIFVGVSVVCELAVLCVAAGFGIASAGLADGGAEGGGVAGSSEFEQESLGRFVIEQVSVSLVLVRLYAAWLAHGLHKLRVQLTFAVLPQLSPKARGSEGEMVGETQRRQALDILVPALGRSEEAVDPCGDGLAQQAELRARSRGRLHRALLVSLLALVLVLTAAGLGVWRVQGGSGLVPSSCRTATRGLDFCVPMTSLGLFVETSGMEECCALCDAAAGCDAWSYAEVPVRRNSSSGTPELASRGRCWRMQFVEEPCSKHPGHQTCRCHTSYSRIGGYRLAS